jgi:hypothetical protein
MEQAVQGRYHVFRSCYVRGLARDRNLTGRVSVRFVTDLGGHVSEAFVVERTLSDCAVTRCRLDEYRKIEFPKPEGGNVTVVYPILFAPG